MDGADPERMDYNELTKNFANLDDHSRNNGSGIDAKRAREL